MVAEGVGPISGSNISFNVLFPTFPQVDRGFSSGGHDKLNEPSSCKWPRFGYLGMGKEVLLPLFMSNAKVRRNPQLLL